MSQKPLRTTTRIMAYWVRYAIGTGLFDQEVMLREMNKIRASIDDTLAVAEAVADEVVKPKAKPRKRTLKSVN